MHLLLKRWFGCLSDLKVAKSELCFDSSFNKCINVA